MTTETTTERCDALLGGRLRLWQPATGYRAGVDPLLLAASVPDRVETLLDLGCGVGAAGLAVALRLRGVAVTGVEVQPAMAALARRNAAENALPLTVIAADLAVLPTGLRGQAFDHVIANPPYFDRSASVAGPDAARETARGEGTPLATWVDVAARRVRPGGQVTFVHRAERLPDLIAAMAARLGSLQVLPLLPRAGRDAHLCLIRGRKGGRAAFRLHAGVVLHAGDAHPGDRDHYTPAITAVLRDAAALPFPN